MGETGQTIAQRPCSKCLSPLEFSTLVGPPTNQGVVGSNPASRAKNISRINDLNNLPADKSSLELGDFWVTFVPGWLSRGDAQRPHVPTAGAYAPHGRSGGRLGMGTSSCRPARSSVQARTPMPAVRPGRPALPRGAPSRSSTGRRVRPSCASATGCACGGCGRMAAPGHWARSGAERVVAEGNGGSANVRARWRLVLNACASLPTASRPTPASRATWARPRPASSARRPSRSGRR